MNCQQWLGLMGPSNMPKHLVDKLAAAMDLVLRMPDVVQTHVGHGPGCRHAGPEEMKRELESDVPRRAKLGLELNVKPLG